MDRTIHMGRRCRCVIFILAAMLLLLIAGSAAAEERHTAVIHCDGGGFVGNAKSGKKGTVTVKPGTEVEAQNGDRWTIAELVKLPDFRLERAAMRFDVINVCCFHVPTFSHAFSAQRMSIKKASPGFLPSSIIAARRSRSGFLRVE